MRSDLKTNCCADADDFEADIELSASQPVRQSQDLLSVLDLAPSAGGENLRKSYSVLLNNVGARGAAKADAALAAKAAATLSLASRADSKAWNNDIHEPDAGLTSIREFCLLPACSSNSCPCSQKQAAVCVRPCQAASESQVMPRHSHALPC